LLGLALDYVLLDFSASSFLARKLLELVEYLKFWR